MGQIWQEAEVIKTPSWDSSFNMCEADLFWIGLPAGHVDWFRLAKSGLKVPPWWALPLSPFPAVASNFTSFGTQMGEVATGHVSVPKGQGVTSLSHFSGCWGWDFHQLWRVGWFLSWWGQNRGCEGNSHTWAKLLLCGPAPPLCSFPHTPIYQRELPRVVLITANIPAERTCPLHARPTVGCIEF